MSADILLIFTPAIVVVLYHIQYLPVPFYNAIQV